MAKTMTKLPKRIWRRDRPQVRAVPEYTEEMYERAFGHKKALNVMVRKWKVQDSRLYCWKCNGEVSNNDVKCPHCKAEIDKES